jgi:putative transposase
MMTGFERYTKKTRRTEFLEEMNQVVPWGELCALIEPHYPKVGNGRRPTVAEAEQALTELETKWKAYPSVSQVWRRNWESIIPFFNYPPEIRRAIYTTNSVESLNRSLRKIIKVRGGFPNEEAALKLLFLALRHAAKKWTMPIHHWREALNHFTILWPERMPALEGAS